MERRLTDLADREFDLVIVGGGIFGICSAWDAVLRGLSVALVERTDFCAGSSAVSYKSVHGGMRYLQHGDVVRVRQSCHERSAMLRVAPHLVHPLPITIPTYGHGKEGKELLTAGFLVYDLLTLGRNRGIADRTRHVPMTERLTRREILDEFPGLQRQGLTGGVLFRDGQMYNPTRLALSFLRAAMAKGVVAANHVEATGFLLSGDRVSGITVCDRQSGETFSIRARYVMNAAGPWADGLLDRLAPRVRYKGTYSRDSWFLVPRQIHPTFALAVQSRTRDSDALLSRPARHVFITPWRDCSLIGTWHKVFNRGPDAVTMGDDEILEFIDEVNTQYPDANLCFDEVSLWSAGLIPFGQKSGGDEDLSFGKRSILIDHQREHGIAGLATLIGIRYTMARGDAAKVVDIAARALGNDAPRPATDRIPIHGGKFETFESVVKEVQAEVPELSGRVARALAHNYGSEFRRVTRYGREDPALLETLGATTVIKAEVTHAVREEMAIALADVVWRRTDLATGGDPGVEVIRICAEMMARELGWQEDRLLREIEEFKRTFPAVGQSRSGQRVGEVASSLPEPVPHGA